MTEKNNKSFSRKDNKKVIEIIEDITEDNKKNKTINNHNTKWVYKIDDIKTKKEDDLIVGKEYEKKPYFDEKTKKMITKTSFKYKTIENKKINETLIKNKCYYEIIRGKCKFYLDIEKPLINDNVEETEHFIFNVLLKEIENYFMVVFNIDLTNSRIVLNSGIKKDKNEYSTHIIYNNEDLVFSDNMNIPLIFYDKYFKYFYMNNGGYSLNETPLKHQDENKIKNGIMDIYGIDLRVYNSNPDKTKSFRMINQTKLKNQKNNERKLVIDENYTTYEINEIKETLINVFNPNQSTIDENYEGYFKDLKDQMDYYKNYHKQNQKIKNQQEKGLYSGYFSFFYKLNKTDNGYEKYPVLKIYNNLDFIKGIDIINIQGNQRFKQQLLSYFIKMLNIDIEYFIEEYLDDINKPYQDQWRISNNYSLSELEKEIKTLWDKIDFNYINTQKGVIIFLKKYLLQKYDKIEDLRFLSFYTPTKKTIENNKWKCYKNDINSHYLDDITPYLVSKEDIKKYYEEKERELKKGIKKYLKDNKKLNKLLEEKQTILKVSDTIKQDKDKNILCLSSPMGSGKSHQIEQLLLKYPMIFKKVLIISPRITYSVDIYNRYKNIGFKIYIDPTTKRPYDKNNVFYYYNKKVLSYESIHKDKLDKYDLIILDEVESIFYGINSPTIEDRERNKDIFFKLIKNTKNIILGDGFITQRTIETFNKLYPMEKMLLENTKINPKQILKFNNINQELDGLNMGGKTIKEELELKKIELQLSKYILKKLKQKQKIYFFSSTYSVLKNIEEELLKSPLLTKEDILVYTRDTKLDIEQNINELWGNKKIILSTTKITIGINFNTENVFNSNVSYINEKGGNVRDVLQNLFRVRYYKDKEVFYVIDKKKNNKYNKLNYDDFKKYFNRKIIINGNDNTLYDHIIKYNEYEDLINKNYMETLYTHLIETKLKGEINNKNDIFSHKKKEKTKEISKYTFNNLYDIPLSYEEQLKIFKENKTEENKQILSMLSFKDRYLTNDKDYFNDNKDELNYIYNIYVNNKKLFYNIMGFNSNDPNEDFNPYEKQKINDIKGLFNINDFIEFNTKNIKKEDLDKNIEIFFNKYQTKEKDTILNQHYKNKEKYQDDIYIFNTHTLKKYSMIKIEKKDKETYRIKNNMNFNKIIDKKWNEEKQKYKYKLKKTSFKKQLKQIKENYIKNKKEQEINILIEEI